MNQICGPVHSMSTFAAFSSSCPKGSNGNRRYGSVPSYSGFDWSRKGKDVRRHSLAKRKRALSGLVGKTSTVLSQVFAVRRRRRDLFAATERVDLEGIVAKRSTSGFNCLAASAATAATRAGATRQPKLLREVATRGPRADRWLVRCRT